MSRPEEQELYITPFDRGVLSAEVRAEVENIRVLKKAWSRIRPLQEGSDNPGSRPCDGSQGNHHLDCTKKVEAVQYNIQGEIQVYCEEHALLQNEWDIIHHWSKPKPETPLTKEEEERIAKLLVKKKSKKEREKEAAEKAEQETDLMA